MDDLNYYQLAKEICENIGDPHVSMITMIGNALYDAHRQGIKDLADKMKAEQT